LYQVAQNSLGGFGAVEYASNLITKDLVKSYNTTLQGLNKKNDLLSRKGVGVLMKEKPHLASKIKEELLRERAVKNNASIIDATIINYSDMAKAAIMSIGAVSSKVTFDISKAAGKGVGKAYGYLSSTNSNDANKR